MNTIDGPSFSDIGLAPPPPSRSKSLGQEDYLELMVAQLRNQDPFQPMQNGEFLAQIAQFGTVSGVQAIEQSISELAESLYSNQALEAAELVGRSVLARSTSGVLTAGGQLTGAVNASSNVGSAVVTIEDKTGNLIKRIELGPLAAGITEFTWDGTSEDGSTAPPGQYVVRAVGNEGAALETLIKASVSSVTLGRAGQGLTLNLDNGTTLDFAEILEIL